VRYYRCKCGKRVSWSSMGVYPCAGCAECNTTLAEDPYSHATPQPHDFSPQPVETNEGTRYLDRCRWCRRTRAEAGAKLRKSMEATDADPVP